MPATLSFDYGDSSSPNVITLAFVNNDGYSSEYRYADAGGKYTAFVRHSTEKTLVNGQKMDRHQVLLRFLETPSEIYPAGRLFESYLIMRNPSAATPAESGASAYAVATWLPDKEADLVGWVSQDFT